MTETNFSIVQTRKNTIAAIACVGVLLLAANAVVCIWRYQAMDWVPVDYAYKRVALFHALAISVGLLVALMIKHLNSTGKEVVIIPAYAALLCFGTYIAVFGIDGRYLGYGITYFTPTMMYAAIFVSSYAATKDFDKLWHKGVMLLLIFGLPLSLAVVGLHSVSVGFTLCVTFVVLLVKLFFIDEKHQHRWTVVIALTVAIFVLFIVCGRTGIIGALTTRIETFVSGGRTDLTGAGYVYHQLINGLKEVQLVGPSRYEISINSENSIPAYAFFANQDSAYSVAAVILRWGWLSGAFMIGVTVALVVLLFKLSLLARNDYARYFSYSVAVLFAVKTVLSLVSCFAVFAREADMPMIGALGGVVDVTLIASVVALCGNDTREGVERN